MQNGKHFNTLLAILFLVETLCVTFLQEFKAAMYLTSIVYTVAGLGIAIVLLKCKFEVTSYRMELKSIYLRNVQYKILITVIAGFVMYRFSKEYFAYNPINFHDADMLPIIKTMCERFLNGKASEVYAPIKEIWGGIKPIYLPALWMPFCIPTFLHIDIRWLSVALFLLIFAYPIWRLNPNKKGSPLMITSIFLLFWWLFSVEDANLIIYTEETVVITIYLLLAVAIIHEKHFFMAIATTMCLLSRYVLIGWIPALIIFSFYNKNWKYIFIQIATSITLFFMLFIYPFGVSLINDMIHLPARYTEFTRRVWKDAPAVFENGLGFAKFFGPGNILLQHNLLIGLSLTIPAIAMTILLAFKKKFKLHATAILLSTLKISLVVFYTLIDVPYLYLFYTSSFLTMVIIMHAEHAIKENVADM